jgi:EAL domain-containing protein (putative c-di-GMP-specific phosphodiesterase class I)
MVAPGMVAPGMVAPGTRMAAIEARMLRVACAEAARWGGIGVCVDIRASDIHDAALPSRIAHALDASGLAPDLLELGLTEAMLGDGDFETLLALSAIRDLGVGLVLDRFDAGPAALRMLERLPLTGLKLDRALVRELPGNAEGTAIARVIIDAGRALDCVIVADGVATEAQRACLVGLGCQEGQGSLFGAALSAEAMRERLGVD